MRTLHQIIILVLILTSALNVFAYQVTSDKAIEVVNAFRDLETDTGAYYIMQTDTLINNYYCHFDTLPNSETKQIIINQ